MASPRLRKQRIARFLAAKAAPQPAVVAEEVIEEVVEKPKVKKPKTKKKLTSDVDK